MSVPLQADALGTLNWLEIDVELRAQAAPHRAHPLVVLEALCKGVFEAAGLDARQVKQLWHVPGQSVHSLGWQAGSRITLTLQLFGLQPTQTAHWQEHLARHLAPSAQRNFTLAHLSPWRNAHTPPPLADAPAYTLDFLTPVPLPHQPGQERTALDGSGFVRICQARLRKLFGREGALPPPPALDTTAWKYWRTEHRSRSQHGHPMFINGCIGPLTLSGETLAAWHPWLALFAAVGLGERLSFGQGRFQLAATEPERSDDTAVELRLRRPCVIGSDQAGVHLALDNGNLVVSRGPGQEETRCPLLRIAHVELHGHGQLSTPLIAACAREGIPLLLAAPGQPPLVIVGQQAEAERNRRLAAHHAAWNQLDEPQRARLAARLVDQKLAGCAWVVRQRYQPGDHRLLERIGRARMALARTEKLASVRGWEGWAARHYHRWLQRHLQPLGEFHTRQHPDHGQDPINGLLNYAYGLLRHHLACAIRLVGLDPWLGILHTANGRHEALVSDLMEPWRPHIDRRVLRWVGLRIIRPDSFVHTDGRLRLTPQARQRIVQDFTQMLESTPRNGGPRLSSRIRALLDGYAAAAASGTLADWSPPEAPNATTTADEET